MQNYLKKQYSIYSNGDLKAYKATLLKDRDQLYKHFTAIQRQQDLEKQNKRKK